MEKSISDEAASKSNKKHLPLLLQLPFNIHVFNIGNISMAFYAIILFIKLNKKKNNIHL